MFGRNKALEFLIHVISGSYVGWRLGSECVLSGDISSVVYGGAIWDSAATSGKWAINRVAGGAGVAVIVSGIVTQWLV